MHYVKGKKANILEAIIEKSVTGSFGGGPNPPKLTDLSLTESINTYRLHAHETGVWYPVITEGFLPETFGKIEPQSMNNDVRIWRGSLEIDDDRRGLEYWESPKEGSKLMIRPSERILTSREIQEATDGTVKKMLEETTKPFANHLEKNLGWRLGPPEFKGSPSIGMANTRIGRELRDAGVGAVNNPTVKLKTDNSPGKLEPELVNDLARVKEYDSMPERMRAIDDFNKWLLRQSEIRRETALNIQEAKAIEDRLGFSNFAAHGNLESKSQVPSLSATEKPPKRLRNLFRFRNRIDPGVKD